MALHRLLSSHASALERIHDRVPTRSPVLSRKGMVACSQPLAAEAGLAVLKAGGNAVDAAVSIGAVLAVTEPCSTGLGGDGFMLYYNAKDKKVVAVNGCGRTPAALTADRIRSDCKVPANQDSIPSFHAHTVTVPGVVAFWLDSIEKFGGKVSREKIFERATELAREGFPVAPICAASWKISEELLQSASANASEILMEDENGLRAPFAGEVMKREGLAKVFEEIVAHGKDGFYKGWVAEAIVKEVKDNNGVMEMEDLASHTTTFPEPIETTFKDVRVWGHPPNGQGITALMALNILSELEKQGKLKITKENRNSPTVLHAQIEALRLAFADARYYVTDPDHHEIPVEKLLSEEYTKSRAALIDLEKAAVDVVRGQPLKDSHTVSFQVVDEEGNAVSMVNSTYMGFGTGLIPKGTGFTLQNRGANFTLREGEPNCIAPKKRPYHTIIPCILTDASSGDLHTTFTNMGGFMQPQGHIQHILNIVSCGMDPQRSIDMPRYCILNDSYSGVHGKVALETGFPDETARALKEMGHDILIAEGMKRGVVGRAQIISKMGNGVLWAGSDGRADGCAMGY